MLVNKVCTSKFDGMLDISLTGISVTIKKILSDCADNEYGFLTDPADHISQAWQINVPELGVSIKKMALKRIVESIDHLDDGAFTGA